MYKCISIIVTGQIIVYSIIVFVTNFKVLQNESKKDRKITKWRVLLLTYKIQQYLKPLF